MTKGCYLIHLDAPLSQGLDPRTGKPRAARHYLGYADDIEARIERHRKGNGSRLMEVVAERGIAFQVARLWPDTDRAFERRLHNRKDSPRMCPICREQQTAPTGAIDPESNIELRQDAIEQEPQ